MNNAKEGTGKRKQIIDAAQKMFFEKGFDGVTIRAVQREVGCEVGLFYYYFKSKDEIFEVIFDRFEDDWKKSFEKAVENPEIEPFEAAKNLFESIKLAKNKLEKESRGVMHWSVKLALQRRLTKMAEPFFEKIIETIKDFGGVRTEISVRELARLVALGIGGLLLDEEKITSRDAVNLFESILSTPGSVGLKARAASFARKEISVELL
ncbi:MAG: TetR/AcrR family transcriptional regulator [Clostridia bacterium]|nr:TetR/AcrR family transcriptional regulator [Clostridia bacterium]